MGNEVANEVLSKKTNQHASEESNAGLSMSRQEEMPFAVVQGKELTALPKDLYIPPDALEIILEAFEGPLDLLLYLIRRQNLDILEIDVAEITKQYMGYIDLMSTIQLELASEYLVMAAMLAEIKSRILLPRQVAEDDDEGGKASRGARLDRERRTGKTSTSHQTEARRRYENQMGAHLEERRRYG